MLAWLLKPAIWILLAQALVLVIIEAKYRVCALLTNRWNKEVVV